MNEEPHLLTERVDSILVATLNRPAKLNAMSPQMLQLIDQAINTFRDDKGLRVLLFRATGRYFCAGVDLTQSNFTEDVIGSAIRQGLRRENTGFVRMWEELEAIEKPVVIAHHAACVGGGLELSLSCDFRLAAKSASYSFPEAVFGSIPASGGVSRLTRFLGPHWARYIIMANKPVDADRALQIGLVHEVFPDHTFEKDVMDFCRHLAGLKPEVTGMAKLAIELAVDLQSAQARNMERLANSALMIGKEYIDGMAEMRTKLSRNNPPRK
jgi:enoyl-CoA hydratase/carnithine racemase